MAIRPARLPLLPTKVLLRLARVDRANISPNKTSGGTTPPVSYACRVLAALRVHPWQRCTVHSAKHRRSAGLKENKQIDQANTEKKKPDRSASASPAEERRTGGKVFRVLITFIPRVHYTPPHSNTTSNSAFSTPQRAVGRTQYLGGVGGVWACARGEGPEVPVLARQPNAHHLDIDVVLRLVLVGDLHQIQGLHAARCILGASRALFEVGGGEWKGIRPEFRLGTLVHCI